MNKMKLVIGDWSDDGHGKTDSLIFEVNYTVEQVQQAYKDSCKLTGISFNHNQDYTGRNREGIEHGKYLVCVEYCTQSVSEEVISILDKYDYPYLNELNDEEGYLDQDDYVKMWWWFVGLSLDELEYNKVEDDVPVINGYWNNNLNVQFGYGLYE